jgi:1,4-alpha-glucan branching enzyme
MSRTPARPADVEALVARDLADPHRLLGAHPDGNGAVVRAFRPDATRVVVRPDGRKKSFEMERIHPDGLFETKVKKATFPLSYELDISYPDGTERSERDAYSFAPTLGDLDLHLLGEGRHEHLYDKLGAHVTTVDGVRGTRFAVWAPAASSVSLVGDFNLWDGRRNPMRALGASGVWELFVPDVAEGAVYKYEIRGADGVLTLRADPVAFQAELLPGTSSVVHKPKHPWRDGDWRRERAATDPLTAPMSTYEVHLGSWRRDPADPERQLSYTEIAEDLAAYAVDMGFTHVELMPVMAHPYGGSWGYQVTSLYAPVPGWGTPDEFRQLVDTLHNHGIGVVLDWVPAHFPRDEWALARFDGTALYEHEDPRRGSHPDWGTLVFNHGRHEVRNFLVASALYWLEEQHADGIRVDAVASMLYLDYSRKDGEWVPNEHGGNEDLEAVSFLQEANAVIHRRVPGVVSAAEESTAWPGVSRPAYLGGLGFGFKWNMGWMHDTLDYFSLDPVHRSHHHHQLTFSLVYAFTENFVLPLSHDEVVHGKGSLIDKMPGDRWQKFANLRALYGYMWAHPGKKLLFMGGELAQEREWSEMRSLDWDLLERPEHAGIQRLVRDLNHVYRDHPALWQVDFEPAGFTWLEPNDADRNVIAFLRRSADGGDVVACVANLSPVPQPDYRLGFPTAGRWTEALNTDSTFYGGSDMGNLGGVIATDEPWHDQPYSATVTLPPLAMVWLVPADDG